MIRQGPSLALNLTTVMALWGPFKTPKSSQMIDLKFLKNLKLAAGSVIIRRPSNLGEDSWPR